MPATTSTAYPSTSDAAYVTCPKCGETKPSGHFNKWKRQCKECRAAVQRDYAKSHQRELYESNKRWRDDGGRFKAKCATYGITAEDYWAMHEAQGGVCAICKGDCPSGRQLAIDHDHSCCPGSKACGRCVRGLLCARCNAGLAQFRDDLDLLTAAGDYLKK